MRKLLLLSTSLAYLTFAFPRYAGAPPLPPPSYVVPTPQTLGRRVNCQEQAVVNGALSNAAITAAPAQSDTSFCVAKGNINHLWMWFPSHQMGSGLESPNGNVTNPNESNVVFHRASVQIVPATNLGTIASTIVGLGQMPTGTLPPPLQFTWGGSSLVSVDPNGNQGALSDPLPIFIPAGSRFYYTIWTGVSAAPTLTSTGNTTGGTLAAGTYFTEATCVKLGVESGPSNETTVTTTGATSSIANTITADTYSALGCDSANMYRGTASNGETWVTNVPTSFGPSQFGQPSSLGTAALSYLDTGVPLVTGARAAPTVASSVNTGTSSILGYAYGDNVTTNWLTNSNRGCGANPKGTDQTGTTGSYSIQGPCNSSTAAYAIFGDDHTSPSVCGLGDSIEAGNGNNTYNTSAYTVSNGTTTFLNSGPTQVNWFDIGLANYYYLNASIPGSEINYFFTPSIYTGQGASNFGTSSVKSPNTLQGNRLFLMDACTHVISDLGTNDFGVGNLTWQGIAANHMAMAYKLSLQGIKYYTTTLLPRVTTTDNMLTIGNQTQQTWESSRVALNTWERNGMQVTYGGSANGSTCFNSPQNGTLVLCPVTIGGTQTMGTPGGIVNFFDLAQASGEVNSSNVPTMNGGFWPVFSNVVGTYTTSAAGTASGGNGTFALSSAIPLAGVNNLGNDMVRFVSGTSSGGSCFISQNTSVSITCTEAGSTMAGITNWSVGDTLTIRQAASLEGTHPTTVESAAIGAALAAWAALNIY